MRIEDMYYLANVDVTDDEIAEAAQKVAHTISWFEERDGHIHVEVDDLHDAPVLTSFSAYLGYIALVLEDSGTEDPIALIEANQLIAEGYFLGGGEPLIAAYEMLEPIYGVSNVGIRMAPRNTIRTIRRAAQELKDHPEYGDELSVAMANLLEELEERAKSLIAGLSRRDAELKLTAELPGYKPALQVAYMALATVDLGN